MKSIELSIGTVEIIENLTWGMYDDIQEAMLSGLKITGVAGQKKEDQKLNFDLSNANSLGKYKALEVCVKKITLKDGKEVAFSKEWMRDLSVEDGEKLLGAVNEVTKPKKK